MQLLKWKVGICIINDQDLNKSETSLKNNVQILPAVYKNFS